MEFKISRYSQKLTFQTGPLKKQEKKTAEQGEKKQLQAKKRTGSPWVLKYGGRQRQGEGAVHRLSAGREAAGRRQPCPTASGPFPIILHNPASNPSLLLLSPTLIPSFA